MTKTTRGNYSWKNRHSASKIGKSLKKLAAWVWAVIVKIAKKPGLIKNLFLASVAAILLGSIFMLALYAWVSRDLPDPNTLSNRDVPQSTKIYDRTGTHLLYEISGDEKRTLVLLSDLPTYIKYAAVTAEDRKFYSHHGIDFKGIARAIFTNVTRLDPTGQGASTITQQLTRHAILSTEKTVTRKLKEILLSLAMERRYSKDEIMQLYLNEIPFGSNNYGIESASQAYFGKSAKDLTLAEAATIIAITNRPTTLLNNPDLLKARRDWILNSMADLKYVTREEADAALAIDTPVIAKISNISAAHFVLWVKEQIIELGYTDREVEQGGLKITTTLDWDKQKLAEEAVVKTVTENGPVYNFNNASLVSLDPRTGEVLAMVGSADYFNDEIQGQVNVALRPRQPGSSMKPIIYAAAFEKGYTPNTLLWDVNTVFPTETGPYEPKNYNLKENGQVSMRKALQGSLNIPAVKTLYLVGVENGLKFAERLHYSTLTDRSRFGLSMVLGGAEVTLLDHAAAYATFATEGSYHAPVSILKIERPNAVVDFEWKPADGEKVMEPNIARTMSNVLSDDGSRAYVFGAGGPLTLPGRPVAAKTGTTNDYNDAWTMGYTPSLVTGVWVGNTDGKDMKKGADSSKTAAPIWHTYMVGALKDTPVEGFVSPQIATTGKNVLDGVPPTQRVIIDSASGKLATELTPERLKIEKVCGEYHEILRYVDRNDPLGPVPTDPGKDVYYNPWENALTAYIERYNAAVPEGQLPLEKCEIPTEFDDVHLPQYQPDLRILAPDNNAEVARTFEVQVEASAPRGLSRLEFLIDGTTVRTSSTTSGATLTLPGWVDMGGHTLTVVAYDDVDNAASREVRITVIEPGTGSKVTITNPFNNQEIAKISPTYQLVVELQGNESVTTITMSATNTVTGEVTAIGELVGTGAIRTINWTLPAAGEYLISAIAVGSDGSSFEAAPVKVFVKEKT